MYVLNRFMIFLAVVATIILFSCSEVEASPIPMERDNKKDKWKMDKSDSKRLFSHNKMSSKTDVRQSFKSGGNMDVKQNVVGGNDNSKTVNVNLSSTCKYEKMLYRCLKMSFSAASNKWDWRFKGGEPSHYPDPPAHGTHPEMPNYGHDSDSD